jgi:signal transduction histidine kinase
VTFQRKLFLGFFLMILPVVLIGVEALRANRSEHAGLQALGQGMARTRTYAQLETAMHNQTEAVWRYLSGLDPRAQADFELIEKVVRYWQERWKSELEPGEEHLAGEIQSLHDEVLSVSKQVFELDRTGRHEDAYHLAETELKGRLLPALDDKNKEVYRLLRENSVQGAFARLEAILAEERRVLFVILALSFAVGLGASILIARGLARPLRELRSAMDVIGAGQLDHPIDVRSRDEVGDLARAFARMTENLARSREAMADLNADLAAKIRKLEETQAQLVQSEKLASIGEMSAAVAHGLRNPLASLRAAAQVALHQMKDTPAAQEHLRAIIAEVDRLDRRISHLLSFSRPAPFRPLDEGLPHLVRAVLPTFERQLAERGVAVEADLPDGLPQVRVDPMQVEQALVEVISNAMDAMPKGGRLTVRGTVEPDGGGGERAVIEVADTGDGISPQVLPSVCDPFFTTRPEGTGLGLAIARRYVAQNGGSLEIASVRGAGTTVRLVFPVVPHEAAAPTSNDQSPLNAGRAPEMRPGAAVS